MATDCDLFPYFLFIFFTFMFIILKRKKGPTLLDSVNNVENVFYTWGTALDEMCQAYLYENRVFLFLVYIIFMMP